MPELRVHLVDPGATSALGEAIGRLAIAGTVVALHGDLGAGKTVLARGLAAGLGVHGGVRSPTFLVVRGHEGGRIPLWHADWYRLGSVEELEQIGLPEMLDGSGCVVVEWADRFPMALPSDRLEVDLRHEGTARRATIRATGPRHLLLLEALRA